MLKCCLYEEAFIKFWEEGLIAGELVAFALEAELPIKFKRVCILQTIPYIRYLENQVLPNTRSIIEASLNLMNL